MHTINEGVSIPKRDLGLLQCCGLDDAPFSCFVSIPKRDLGLLQCKLDAIAHLYQMGFNPSEGFRVIAMAVAIAKFG